MEKLNIRKWLILKLAGTDLVILNAKLSLVKKTNELDEDFRIYGDDLPGMICNCNFCNDTDSILEISHDHRIPQNNGEQK